MIYLKSWKKKGKKELPTKNLLPDKIILQNEGEIKTWTVKQKLRVFITAVNALPEILKEFFKMK